MKKKLKESFVPIYPCSVSISQVQTLSFSPLLEDQLLLMPTANVFEKKTLEREHLFSSKHLGAVEWNAYCGRMVVENMPRKDAEESTYHMKLIRSLEKRQKHYSSKEKQRARDLRSLKKDAIMCWEACLCHFTDENKKKMLSCISKYGAPPRLRPPVWKMLIGNEVNITRIKYGQVKHEIRTSGWCSDICRQLMRHFTLDSPCLGSLKANEQVLPVSDQVLSRDYVEHAPNSFVVYSQDNSSSVKGDTVVDLAEHDICLPLPTGPCDECSLPMRGSSGNSNAWDHVFMMKSSRQRPLSPLGILSLVTRRGEVSDGGKPFDAMNHARHSKECDFSIHRMIGNAELQRIYSLLLTYMSSYSCVEPFHGMPYIAAMVQLVMVDEFDVFNCFANIVESFKFVQFFSKERFHQFEVVLAEAQPVLSDLFKEHSVASSTYLHDWWSTMFCRSLPFASVIRCWDLILLDEHYMYRIALALLVYLFELYNKHTRRGLRRAYRSAEEILQKINIYSSRTYINEELLMKIIDDDVLCGMGMATLRALVSQEKKLNFLQNPLFPKA